MKTNFQNNQFNLNPQRLVYMGFFSNLFGGGKKKEEEVKAEAPAEAAKCPNCGGEMAEGHVCPTATEEAPAETPTPEVSTPETPAEPASE